MDEDNPMPCCGGLESMHLSCDFCREPAHPEGMPVPCGEGLTCDNCGTVACNDCEGIHMVKDPQGYLCRACRVEYETQYPGTYVGDQYGNRVREEDTQS